MAKTRKSMEIRKSLMETISAQEEADGQGDEAVAAEVAEFARVGVHRAGGAGVNHDDRVVAAHRPQVSIVNVFSYRRLIECVLLL